jgi:glycosyltransferase involved in cell wall biosynthesis
MMEKRIILLCLIGFSVSILLAPILHASRNKHFMVVIPSRNNSQWVERNLSSLHIQSYANWHAIYLNDSSEDDTAQRVAQFIKDHRLEDKILLINNEKRHGALANMVRAVYMCDHWDIIVTLDGDDWLKGPDVLQKLNEVYADDNIWMTYGSYEQFSTGKNKTPSFSKQIAIPKDIITSNGYRKYQWCSSHLRTFYAWLFKCINIEDLKLEGEFFLMAGDLAHIIPMLELSGGRFKYITDILYIYNIQTPHNDHKVNRQLQAKLEKEIRARTPYKPLKEIPAAYLPRR